MSIPTEAEMRAYARASAKGGLKRFRDFYSAAPIYNYEGREIPQFAPTENDVQHVVKALMIGSYR